MPFDVLVTLACSRHHSTQIKAGAFLLRRMVEARGVEPLSGMPSTLVSTRLANDLVVSETLGPSAAVRFLGACLILIRSPVPRLPIQLSK